MLQEVAIDEVFPPGWQGDGGWHAARLLDACLCAHGPAANGSRHRRKRRIGGATSRIPSSRSWQPGRGDNMEATDKPSLGVAQALHATGVFVEPRSRGAAGATLHLRLHSADGLNRLGRSTVVHLREALLEGAADPAVALVVIEAVGDAFCAGGDQQEQAAMDGDAFRAFAADLVALYEGLLGCPAPVLARVHGNAVGGGAAIALACDMVVAAAEAKFAFPEARLGLAGPGFLLHRAGAFQRFAGLCFSGRAATAQD
ncbi:MAG: enoyl-CoA hydratase/isomerase family protein, partial [Comamonadaceae bacterium]